MANSRISKTINIPTDFSGNQRLEIGKKIVEYILDITNDGKSPITGNKFISYSDDYKNSLDFKIAGKRKGVVDLRLTGDMMSDLDIVSHGEGYIEIGYPSSYYGAGKVEGNVTGERSGKPRDFIGISKKKLDEIIKEVSGMSEEAIRKNRENEKGVEKLLERVQDENE